MIFIMISHGHGIQNICGILFLRENVFGKISQHAVARARAAGESRRSSAPSGVKFLKCRFPSRLRGPGPAHRTTASARARRWVLAAACKAER